MVSTAWVLMLQTIAFSLLSLDAVNNLFPSLSLLPGMYLESVILYFTIKNGWGNFSHFFLNTSLINPLKLQFSLS